MVSGATAGLSGTGASANWRCWSSHYQPSSRNPTELYQFPPTLTTLLWNCSKMTSLKSLFFGFESSKKKKQMAALSRRANLILLLLLCSTLIPWVTSHEFLMVVPLEHINCLSICLKSESLLNLLLPFLCVTWFHWLDC
jgi:hypothetical protein